MIIVVKLIYTNYKYHVNLKMFMKNQIFHIVGYKCGRCYRKQTETGS